MKFLRKYPLFLILLPIFFVFHGFIENYPSVPVKNALILVVIYLCAALVIALLFFWFYKDVHKAALATFILIAFNFFFGSIQDILKNNFEGTFFSRYVFIIPLSLGLILFLAIWLKRVKSSLAKLVFYLNALFILLILIDGAWLVSRTINPRDTAAGSPDLPLCETCSRPDIYFIILDGYSGHHTLQQAFGFDNSGFENELRNKGFYVAAKSISNYNYTPFSLASMLNMRYLDLDMKTKGAGNLNYCHQMIRENSVTRFLSAYDYELYNYSIFDFEGQPAIHTDPFISSRTKLITAQTFLSRIWKDILFNIGTNKWNIRPIQKRIVFSHLQNNNEFTTLTKEAASKKGKPKFVYTHLMMPHHPYYFDSKGNALPFDSLGEGKQYNRKNYIEYLQYCNGKILDLCGAIFQNSYSPPIIILAGDHGFRFPVKQENKEYCFNNLLAVYLPSGNYNNFYDSLSNINLFPLVFNTQFKQTFPVRKDSTVYLWD